MPFWRSSKRAEGKTPSSSQQDIKKEEMFSTAGDYGLRTLAEGDTDIVDIIFVHGLTGNRETTWTYRDSIFWPRDLLPKESPNVRIMTFGYDADIVGTLKTVGSNTLRDHGKSLANDLAMRRMRTNSNLRPLIFVAHSLGGLVVEQALLLSRGSSQQHVKQLVESTVAIAFMGTPHLGSGAANLARPLTHLSNLLRKTNKEIVAVLQPGSEMLAAVQQEFHTMLEDRGRNEGRYLDIFCFYEEIAYPGIGEIVPRQSAILPAYPSASIHQNHSDMTKFASANDPGFIRVRDQLWLWTEAVRVKNMSIKEKEAEDGTATELTDRAQQPSNVNSGGGPLFMGNLRAGRDINI